jgi:tetratricopeptide (TPR) repeat protein
VAAYALYLKANRLLRDDSLDAYRSAQMLYQQAIELDPYFWSAHELLIFAVASEAFRSMNFEAGFKRVDKFRQRIEALDPDSHRPDLVTAELFQHFRTRNWPAQERILREQIRSQPTSPEWLGQYAYLLGNAGLFKVALDYSRLAERSDPLNPRHVEFAGNMLEPMGQYQAAIAEYRRCLVLEPNRVGCHGQIAQSLARLGRLDEALLVETQFDSPWWDCLLRGLAGLSCPPPFETPVASWNGFLAAVAGDFDVAFEWYEKATNLPAEYVSQIRWQMTPPEDFRSDPRFEALLAKLNFTDSVKAELCWGANELTAITGVLADCGGLEAAVAQ